MNKPARCILVYHHNPYLCSIYSQHVLAACPQFWSAVLVSSPVELARLKDMVADGLIACVVFDVSDYPIVDLEMGDLVKTYFITWPEDHLEIVTTLGGVHVG